MKTKAAIARLCLIVIGAAALFAGGVCRAADAGNPFTPPNFPVPQFPDRAFNVRDYGAKGDGITNDTAAFNAAIAACNAAGGGAVLVPAGKYLAASVHVLSNVCLSLDDAATIVGGPAGAFLPAEPNPYSAYQDFGHSHFQNALFYGADIENFAVLGGAIDGGVIITGDPADGIGDKIFSIIRSKNLLFENITFTKGGHFVWLLNDCETITIANNVIKQSRDAIDIMGCRNVQIHDNNFTGCSDDTIGIKSDYALGRRITSQNIYAWSCYFETNCNGVQFGSETAGDFYNVNVWDITIGKAGKAGLGITCNDSAIIDGVRMDNITIKGATCPIYMLISDRLRTGEPGVTPGVIRNVVISNVTATDCKPNGSNNVMPSAISGMPAYPLENITLENVSITMPGGGSDADAAIYNPIYPTDYSPRSIGILPAAGLFARHVRGLTLRNVTLSYTASDKRTPFVALDIDGLTLDQFNTGTTDAPARARLDNVTNLEILASDGLPDGITSYAQTNPTQATTFEAEALPRAITGAGTIASSTDMNPSGGAYLTLNGGTIGTTLAFTLPSIPPGVYNLTVGAKQNNNRATAQLQIDGINIGEPWDQYGSSGAMITKDYGKVTLAAGTHTIALTITGRSASSSGYTLTADYFRFTPDASSAPAAPAVTDVSPATAKAGDTITITGANLTGASVTIGGVTAPIVSNDGTTLKITVPVSTTTGTIIVTTTGGNVTAVQTLTITPAASITTEPHTALITIAGIAGPSGSTDGPSATALFAGPFGLVTDIAGNLYIADIYDSTIRRLDPNGQVTTLAGISGVTGTTDGSTASALFCAPAALAISPDQATLYVTDIGNGVRAINLATNQVTTIVTNGLYNLFGLAVDVVGNLYIANTAADAIIKIAATTGAQTTIVAAAAGLFAPAGLAFSPDGSTLYVADTGNGVIRAINLATNQVTTIAGAVGEYAAIDGAPTAARFNFPRGLAADAVGNLYIADASNNLIRKIAVGTHTVTTLVGTPGVAGSLDGFGSQAQLNDPCGITIDDAGDIYIADTRNNTIRVLQVGPEIVTQPASQTVKAGSPASFTVVASGAPYPAYQWFHGSTAIASATAATYDIPAATTADAGSYTVTLSNTMNTVTSSPVTLTVTATTSSTTAPPPPTPNNNSNGGGGGGAPTLYSLAALSALTAARLRKQRP